MTNRFKTYLIVSMLCFEGANAISLKQSVEKTLNNNPTIIAEYLNRDGFKKYIDEEEGDYLPTLDLEVFAEKSKTYNDPDDSVKNQSEKDGWNGVLKLEHILYDGGLTPSQAAEFRYKYYGNNYRSSNEVEGVVLDTANAYLDLVSTQELTALSKNNIKTHEEYLVIAKEKEQISGEVLETYQVNSKYHFILDRYLEQENEKDKSLSLYKKLVGEEIQGDICRPNIQEYFIPGSLEEAIDFGLRRNYKIKEQIEKIKEQKEKIVQADAPFKPTILFQLQGQLDDDLELEENGRQDIYRARIFMTWNLFEGGKNYHASKKEQLFLKEEQKRLDEITNEVVDQIKSSYRTYQNYKKRIENIKMYVEDNADILKVYKKQLADGTRTFLDILNAESELYRADIDKIRQEFDYIKSYYRLLFDLSILSDTILMTEDQTCREYKFIPRIDETKKTKEDDKLSDELMDLFKEETPKIDENLDKNDDVKEDANLKKEQIDISSRLESIYGNEKIIDKNDIIGEADSSLDQKDTAKANYTLNMGNFHNEKEVEDFIKKYSLEDQSSFYKFDDGKAVKLIYGTFDSVKKAKDAMKNINKKALVFGAYIDNYKKHQMLKEKYKDLN